MYDSITVHLPNTEKKLEIKTAALASHKSVSAYLVWCHEQLNPAPKGVVNVAANGSRRTRRKSDA